MTTTEQAVEPDSAEHVRDQRHRQRQRTAGQTFGHQNSVHVIGRLAAAAEMREMPSGDTAVVWRVVVDRDDTSRGRVDTLACVAWTAATRRIALRWQPGDVVEIEGALRRRFWRSLSGPANRYEIEVTRVRRIGRGAT